MAGAAGALLAACGSDRVEKLPPLERPSAELRAGLPVLKGMWRFAGFEIPPEDTGRVRQLVYAMVPPGEIRLAVQRLDSIAGQYVRDSVGFPFVGEVRRDGIFSLVAYGTEGMSEFVAGRVVKDTLWMELTSISAAQTWPPRTRAAFVRGAVRAPFRRLLGGVPILSPEELARRDSLRRDSLLRAGMPPGGAPAGPAAGAPPRTGGQQPPPVATPPAARDLPPPAQRQPPRRDTAPRIDTTRTRVTPPRGPARIDSVRVNPPRVRDTARPAPTPPPVPPPPARPNVPRDTIRFPPR
jgi:hypothetical protein